MTSVIERNLEIHEHIAEAPDATHDVDAFLDSLSRRALRPEQRLCLAVLDLAIRDVQGTNGGEGVQERRDDALRWFNGESPDWPFNFEDVCFYLRLAPGPLRDLALTEGIEMPRLTSWGQGGATSNKVREPAGNRRARRRWR